MTAHSFSHMGKVLRFDDSDLVRQTAGAGIHDKFSLMETATYVVLEDKGKNIFDEQDFKDFEAMDPHEFDSKFSFSMTLLVREAFGI